MNDKSNIKTPLDPSGDFAEMINDTTGLPGITTNNKKNTPPQVVSSSNVATASNFRYDKNMDTASDNLKSSTSQEPKSPQKTEAEDNSSYLQNETLNSAYADSVKSEQDISGTTSDPASDDDTLKSAQKMGLAQNEDEEHPQELNIGEDIDKSEEYQKTH